MPDVKLWRVVSRSRAIRSRFAPRQDQVVGKIIVRLVQRRMAFPGPSWHCRFRGPSENTEILGCAHRQSVAAEDASAAVPTPTAWPRHH